MKLIAVEKRNYTMQYWQAITDVDAAGNVTRTYTFKSAIRGQIASGKSQTYLFADEALAVGDQLREVKDAEGNYVFVVYDTPQAVYVHNVTPVVDIYGRVTSYRHVLRTTAPTNPVGGSH